MNHRYTNRSFVLAIICLSCHTVFPQIGPLERGGGCLPPTATFTNTSGDTARICQGDVISVNGSSSTAAPGRTIEQWIWDQGSGVADTNAIPFAILQFPIGGVHMLTLEVIDDIGCSSGPTAPVPVLVSATPDFSGTDVPETACEGASFSLTGIAVQAPMIGAPEACSITVNGIPILDSQTTPTISSVQVSGQPGGTITDVGQLGGVCLEMEHSYMGDLVITLTCPNGQNVVLHQQGGGGTFIGGALDGETTPPTPGECWSYCWLPTATNGTWAENAGGGSLPAGTYESVQPLSQLVGCPVNGTWTLTINDLFGVDDGFLCGWCIPFGNEPDSSFYELGPVLGTSADSSFWSGPSVVNTPGLPGTATYTPVAGGQTIVYTVVDSYGCEHEALFDVEVGAQPEVVIVEDTELGLVCAQVNGPVSYQWSFQGQLVVGAAGSCFTPPGPGLIEVFVENEQGCSANASMLTTGAEETRASDGPTMHVHPVPNDGTFNIQLSGLETAYADLRIVDMAGRIIHSRNLGDLSGETTRPVALELASGPYLVELLWPQGRSIARFVVQ